VAHQEKIEKELKNVSDEIQLAAISASANNSLEALLRPKTVESIENIIDVVIRSADKYSLANVIAETRNFPSNMENQRKLYNGTCGLVNIKQLSSIQDNEATNIGKLKPLLRGFRAENLLKLEQSEKTNEGREKVKSTVDAMGGINDLYEDASAAGEWVEVCGIPRKPEIVPSLLTGMVALDGFALAAIPLATTIMFSWTYKNVKEFVRQKF